MKKIALLLSLMVPLLSFSQEVPLARRTNIWHVYSSVIPAANRIFDSIHNQNFPIDTAFVLNDSIISLRGTTVDTDKRFSERLFVKRINDTLWTRPDPYITCQYFSCSENDCCLICDKGATACICQTPNCSGGKCTERTYGTYPVGGVSNAVRSFIIISNGKIVPED